MSTIAAGTTTGTALVSTGDTTGALVFKVNTNTTALTLNSDGSATFTGSVAGVSPFSNNTTLAQVQAIALSL
jgi:hypothetical protein